MPEMRTSLTLQSAISYVIDLPRSQYLLLGVMTLAAAILRLYELGTWSFWIDEIFTLQAAPNIGYWPIARVPISLVGVQVATQMLGVSEFSARLFPAIVGILTIPILFWPLRRAFGIRVGLATVFILALHPWHIAWSQNVRFYTVLLLFYALGLIILYDGLAKNQPRYMILGLAFLLLAVREKVMGAVVIPALMSYVLALMVLPFPKPRWLNIKYFFILISPGIVYLIYDGLSYLFTGYSQIGALFLVFGGQQFQNPVRLSASILYSLGFPLVTVALTVGAHQVWKQNQKILFFLMNAVTPVLLLIAVNPLVFTKDRYIFVTLPCWILVAVLGAEKIGEATKLGSNLLMATLLLFITADSMSSNLVYYEVNHGNRRDWRYAFDTVDSMAGEDDVVVTWWPELGGYYTEQPLLRWEDTTPEMVAEMENPTWFVTDSETIWGNHALKHWVEQNAELVDVVYIRMRKDDFSLRIFHYDPELHGAER